MSYTKSLLILVVALVSATTFAKEVALTDSQKENIKHAIRIAKQDGNKHPDLLVGVLMQESMLGEAKKYKVAGTVEKYYGLGQVKLRAAKEVLKEYPKLYSFLPNRSDFEIIKAMKNNSVFAVELASKYLIMLGINKNPAYAITAYNRGPAGAKFVEPSKFHYTRAVYKHRDELRPIIKEISEA